MRKLKDVLRLKLNADQSHQQIATALGIAKGSVTKYCSLAAAAGLDWGAVDAMSETDLEQRLFGSSVATAFARPDYGRIHQELRRKGVTVMLLWQEYSAQVGEEHCAENPVKALRYSQFSENYRQFAKRLKRSMRLVHRAGEKMFIDYAGPTVPLIEHGLEVGRANIFVATMAASGYSFALATPRQTAADWLHGTACALTFFGGTPQLSRARDNWGNQQDRIM
jgi:transposase